MGEVGLPSPVLAQGISVVDTPGVGALRSGATNAVLGFLPFADVLVFVTDASSELTAPEIEFLDRARRECPSVFVAITKINMHLEWRRIAELTGDHLERAGLEVVLQPVSADLGGLDVAESGLDALVDAVQFTVAEARAGLATRAATDLTETLDHLARPLQAELSALEAGRGTEAELDRLRSARAQIAELRTAGGKWRSLLADGLEDLSDVYEHFSQDIRSISEAAERRISETDPASEMDRIEDEVKHQLTATITSVCDTISNQGGEIARGIADLVADLDIPGLDAGVLPEVDLDSIWEGRASQADRQRTGVASTGLAALRGAQGGLFTMGLLARLAGVALSGPIALGVGGFFGIKQIREVRKRGLRDRRREAQQVVRQFLEQVQTEMRGHMRSALRELRRTLRDHFEELFASLADAYNAAATSAETAVAQGDKSRTARIGQLRAELGALRVLLQRLETSENGQ
jgi:hypothetical protein